MDPLQNLTSTKQYFVSLRERKIPNTQSSFLSDEFIILLRFARNSINPNLFLLHAGAIFYQNNICAVNLELLKDVLSCSKSRINNCFAKEEFTKIATPLSKEKNELEKLLRQDKTISSDIRRWTFRKINSNSNLSAYLNSNQFLLVQMEDQIPISLSKFPPQEIPLFEYQALQPHLQQEQGYEASLSFQKDVYTWTFYDDI